MHDSQQYPWYVIAPRNTKKSFNQIYQNHTFDNLDIFFYWIRSLPFSELLYNNKISRFKIENYWSTAKTIYILWGKGPTI